VQESYKTPNHPDQKRNSPRLIIIKTLSTQNKEKILETARRKDKSYIKANPLE
jgi:hypothetical protein